MLTLLLRASPENPSTTLANPDEWLVDYFGGGKTTAGPRVSASNAIGHSTLFACTRVIAETLAALPLKIYRRLPEGGRQEAPDHPLYSVLHSRPNPEISAFNFIELMAAHCFLWGNAYAEIELTGAGGVAALWPLLPDRTRPERRGGRLIYRTRIGGEEIALDSERVLHIPGIGFDGLVGYSFVSVLKQAIGLGMAVEEFGARFFSNGAAPSGVLEHPNTLTDSARKRIRGDWTQLYSGLSNAHRIAILEEGLSYKAMGIPPEDAQFLETRKFQRSEIYGPARVPAHMAGDLEKATFSNIEQQDLSLLKHTMTPWMRRFEQIFDFRLFSEMERRTYFAEFVAWGLMRGDMKTRIESYKAGREMGIYTVNEIRALENMNPVGPEGDVLIAPLNFQRLEDLANQPAGGNGSGAEPGSAGGGTAPGGGGNARLNGLRAAFQRIFEEAIGRCARREAAGLKNAVPKIRPRAAESEIRLVLEPLYRKQEESMIRDLIPPCLAYGEALAAEFGAKSVSGDLEEALRGLVRSRGREWTHSAANRAVSTCLARGGPDWDGYFGQLTDPGAIEKSSKALKSSIFRLVGVKMGENGED